MHLRIREWQDRRGLTPGRLGALSRIPPEHLERAGAAGFGRDQSGPAGGHARALGVRHT
jgi:hypothetical protein